MGSRLTRYYRGGFILAKIIRMHQSAKPTNLRQLRDSGWQSKSVKREIYDNFLRQLSSGEELFPGIIGYQDTVIPEINIALLARHDMLFLGEKGQAKSRLMRLLVRFLDEEIPYLDIPGSPVHEDPLRPITRAGRELVASMPADEVPIAWWPREQRYAERLAPGTKFADIIGEIDPAKLAGGTSMSAEDALHFGLIPRMHRGIFAMNELPELDELVQVGLFNILEERDVQIRGYPDPVRPRRADPVLRQPGDLQPQRQGHPAAQGPHRLGDPHALSARARPGHSDHGAGGGRGAGRAISRRCAVLHAADHRSRSSIAARKSKYIDHQSGVSARFSIANYRTMIASARQRGGAAGREAGRAADQRPGASVLLVARQAGAGPDGQPPDVSERQVLDALVAEAIEERVRGVRRSARPGGDRRDLLPRA